MNKMSHRERVKVALENQPPDRVPLDLGSHPNASIHVEAYEKLKSHLGILSETKLMHRWMQVAIVDEEVLRKFDIDTRRLALGGRDNPLERDLDDATFVDQWGVIRTKPPGTLYFELAESPLAGEISKSDILNYPWPDPHDSGLTRGLRKRALKMRRETDYAVVVNLPAAFVHYSQFLRGFEDWYLDCALNPSLIGILFDAILDVNVAFVQGILQEIGDLIDVVVTADDIGDQRGTLISPAMYHRYIRPRHKRYFDEIHRLSNAKLLYHTCGSVFDVIKEFVKIGVDALNPIQVSAAKMDTSSLKVETGGQLTFWGAIDTQRVLPYGTISDVRFEVRRRIADLGVGGGYILSSVHNIQPEVPLDNILAMFRAARTLGVYSGKVPLACIKE